MTLGQFLTVLRARFGAFFLVLAATVLAAAVLSMVLPKTYRATTSLLVDAKEEQSLSNVLRPLFPPQERLGYLQTQVGVITSHKVARMVVRELKLAEDPKLRAAFQENGGGKGSIEEWLVDGLLEDLKVETSQSSIIRVNMVSRDPQFAAAAANAFAKAYLDTVLELRVEPMRQAAAWFEDQLKALRANVEDAQRKLTNYYRERGIVSADERHDVGSTRLTELSTQLVRAEDLTFDWDTRERQARQSLAAGATPEGLPDVLNNAHVQKLRSDVLLGEAKLQELATQYDINHPAYQRQQNENRALREKLDAEMRKVLTGVENAKRQSRQRAAEIRAAMAQQRAQLLEDKVNRNELMLLTRTVETAQRAYDTAMDRFVTSQVDSRANQANVSVLSAAMVPLVPYRPKLWLNVLLAAAVGTLLGIGIVILGEMLDRRVRAGADLENVQGVPLLAVLDPRLPAVAEHPLLEARP